MKPILNDYYQIFLSCPLGGLMQAARRRMEERVAAWAAQSYTDYPTLDEVRDFIETCEDTPILSEFVVKIFQPLIDAEARVGENTAQTYLDALREEDRIDE
ncbi:MAG: hypothetical protein SOX84_08145 [Prevotella sp.]|nr:hypothetical protein [Prevotella sp.]